HTLLGAQVGEDMLAQPINERAQERAASGTSHLHACVVSSSPLERGGMAASASRQN
ncbi:hypothetical protein E2562_039033, partial [Oryza meyeriana var. granulata]